jgi:hypothetical protein
MNKLPLLFAFALVLSVSSFAEFERREDGNYFNGVKGRKVSPDFDCSRLEIKEDGTLFRDGKDISNLPIGDQLEGLMNCNRKIKGYEYSTPEYSKRRFCSKRPKHSNCLYNE